MEKSSRKPRVTEAQVEPVDNEDLDQADDQPVSQTEEAASEETGTPETAPPQSQDWWSASQPAGDWAQPDAASNIDVDLPKDTGTANVYFCGHTSYFSLNRALHAIAKEKLTGSLRSFWDEDPIDLLTQNGEIVFATTRDLELYCPDAPPALANVDPVMVARARARQIETGTPLFLTLEQGGSVVR